MNTPPYTAKNPPREDIVPYDGISFHTYFWSVPVEEQVTTKGRIIFVHGFSEQVANYYRIFDDLSSEGYEVFYFDQRGAAQTSPDKWTRGRSNEFHVFDDLEFFIERNLEEIGDLKLFMGGHSMGGGIAINYGIHGKQRERLSGVFVSGPCVRVDPTALPNRFVVFVGKLLVKVFPNIKMNTNINLENLTPDKQWKQFILNDPLQTPSIGTLRQLVDFFARGEKLLEPAYASKYNLVPLVVVHGADDRLNDPEATKEFFKHATVPDKKAVFPQNCLHSCFLQLDEKYIEIKNIVIEFLNSH